MHIGIEASRANREKKTGVEWYAYHLIRSLQDLPGSREHEWSLYANTPLTGELVRPVDHWNEVRLSWPPTYLWTQIRLSIEMYRHPPDVLFVPAHVLPRIIPRKSVVTVHDIGFHRHPELYTGFHSIPNVRTNAPVKLLEWTTRDIVRRASKIITVSIFSQQEIVDAYHLDPSRVFVIPVGIDPVRYHRMDGASCDRVLANQSISSPFFLYIGRVEAKKNVLALVKAFEQFSLARGVGDPFRLVLAGPVGAGSEEVMQAISNSPVRDRIRVCGYITEDKKIALLSMATALIHPAWYEGFGITPIEALACECAVICSRVASLPEVVGSDHALWFDPASVDEIAERMTECVRYPDATHDRTALGTQWISRYRWDAIAKQTLDVLTSWGE